MKKDNITIIVPCYNGFKYMGKCLDALENQTYKDFSVLVVDDCSIDNSYEKLIEYKKNTTLNFNVIRNEKNMKLAKTRQIGVAHTNTEWLCFCDCDDWYEYDFLEKMLKSAHENNADMVMCHFNYAYADGRKKYLTGMNILSNKSTKKEFIAYSPMSMCRFIFKKNLFNGLVVPEINNAEDGAVTPQLIIKAKKMAIIHEGLYNYFLRNGSLSTTVSPKIYYDFCEAQEVLDNTIGPYYKKECEFLAIKNFAYGAILNGLKSGIEIKIIKKDYKKFIQKYPKWNINQYISSLNLKRKIFLILLWYKQFALLKVFARIHSWAINKMSKNNCVK